MTRAGGAAKRAFRMAALGATVTGSYLGYVAQSAFLSEAGRAKKLKATHARTASRIRDELLALRGPAMKLGQALSLQTELLPAETLAALSKLQMSAPGMHPSLVRAQFKASMGRDPEDVYASFDPEPFAAASLGQVHRGTLASGARVAVKIQYPGIRAAIENDFTWFRAVSKPAQLSRHMPASAIDELEEQILAECDYTREAANIAFYTRGLGKLSYVEVPRIYPELSTDKILTMSLLRGEHLDAFLARRPSQKLRDLVGERLFELFYFQLLMMEALHADPHWGNYLFRGDGTIGLLDFGCVKYFPRAFVKNLRQIFLFPGPRDGPEFRRLVAQRYAARGTKLTRAALEALGTMSERFYGRVYPPDASSDATPFNFGDAGVVKDYMVQCSNVGRAKGGLPEYVFLARAESGLYQTLHRLRARVHTSAILRRWLASADRAE